MRKGGWFWRLLKGFVGGFAVGGFAGAVGGLIMTALDLAIATTPARPGPIVDRLEQWIRDIFMPFYDDFMLEFEQIKDKSQASINKFNNKLEEFYALKAYYEFKKIDQTGEEEALSEMKIDAIADFIDIIQEAWTDYFGNSEYNFRLSKFEATKHKKIGVEKLDWSKAKSIKAEKLIWAKPVGNVGDLAVVINPTTTPDPDPSIDPKPVSGGDRATSTPPINPDPEPSIDPEPVSGGDRATSTPPINPDPEPSIIPEPGNKKKEFSNRKLLTGVAAIAIAFLLLKK